MSQQETVSFQSAGLRLHGVLSVPDGVKPGEKRAAFLVLHGFGSNSESSNVLGPTRVLSEFGYVTLRFDMPGCGESEGEKMVRQWGERWLRVFRRKFAVEEAWGLEVGKQRVEDVVAVPEANGGNGGVEMVE